jgi:glycosyltransferase involved in cell wall biosynthesis
MGGPEGPPCRLWRTRPWGCAHPVNPFAPLKTVELTILMPCLNEARTLTTCVAKARAFLARHGVAGEVLIADNGSTDGSQALALAAGARVVHVAQRGYGAALRAGTEAARGRFVIMGDSDDSYDFANLGPFLEALRAGHDLVMGNRFRGGIAPGAMPFLHRYLGNPVLSFVGRLFFGGAIGDFHCGLRGYRRDAVLGLRLIAPGMEYASEMVVKALQAELRICEVPTTLSKDGRNRPPHLNTWRDGWRHLRFLLLFSPRWLFLYPGLGILFAGLAQLLYAQWQRPGGHWWPVGIHTQLFAAAGMVMGFQVLLFAAGALLARYGARLDIIHPSERAALRWARGPVLPVLGSLGALTGFSICLAVTLDWGRGGFGALDPESAMRQIIPGLALLLIGAQAFVASVFFAALTSAFDSQRPAVVESPVWNEGALPSAPTAGWSPMQTSNENPLLP